jgi:hypothetical protein
MLTPYQELLLGDVGAPETGYGTPLAGWTGQQPFFKGPPDPSPLGALTPDLALTFVGGVYILLRTKRSITVYRGYESAGLQAPFGKEHLSYIRGLVSQRRPGKPDGLWWTPARPSMKIDNLRLASMHREQHRANSAIKLEWNRLDFYLESELPTGSLIYVGRVAPQQEAAAYGSAKYGGGGYQFRLTDSPERVLRWMRRYVSV